MNIKTKIILTYLLFLIINNTFGQLNEVHYFSPIKHGDNSNLNTSIYVYISTPSVTPITVEIKSPDGSILSTKVIQQNMPDSFLISNTTPSVIFVNEMSLNTVLTNNGLIVEGDGKFYATLRATENYQAGIIVSKGEASFGKIYRLGSIPIPTGYNPSQNATFSFIATEDNTTVTVSDYHPNITLTSATETALIPPPPETGFTVTLNAGESYVVETKPQYGIQNLDGLIGTLITSDKNITVSTGNFLGGWVFDNRDFTIDQTVLYESVGQEYILIEGAGNRILETPIIVATQDNTNIYINGSATPVATINSGGGNYFSVPSSYYTGSNQ